MGSVERKQTNSRQGSGWLWLPLIVGLILGFTVTVMTDQWWWTTIGVLVGAVFGAVSSGKLRRPGSRADR